MQMDTILLSELVENLKKAMTKYGGRPVLIEYDGEFVNMSGYIIPLYNPPAGVDKSEPSRLIALGLLTDSSGEE
jgi:hypothetical protein